MLKKHSPILILYDKTTYDGFVVEKSEEGNKIRVHYNGFDDNLDEWIDIDSDRITKHDDDVSDEVRIALGNIMRLGRSAEKIICLYNPIANHADNSKWLNSLLLPDLQACAEVISIKTKDDKNKPYKKADLIQQILSKIKSALPKKCQECSEEYSIEVKEEPLFTCHICKDGSHNCDNFQTFKNSSSNIPLRGIVWICGKCNDDPPPVLQTELIKQTTEAKTEVKLPQTASPSTTTTSGNNATNGGETHDPQRSPDTCILFMKGKCQHGISGNRLVDNRKCQYSHPKKCKKYLQYGSGGRLGCKWGRECNKLHPFICRNSRQGRKCNNRECTYVHPRVNSRPDSDYWYREYPENTQRTETGYRKYPHHIHSANTNYRKYPHHTPRAEKRFNEQYNIPLNEYYPNHETHPKNDQLERIEQIINAMKRDQEEERKKIRTEMHQALNQIHYRNTQSYAQMAQMAPRPQETAPTYTKPIPTTLPQGREVSDMPRSYY